MDAFHKPGIQTAVISTALGGFQQQMKTRPRVEVGVRAGGWGKTDPNLSVPFGAVRQVLRRDSRPKKRVLQGIVR